MDLVSVIVPVYNGETEMNRCIDSILNQTYKEIELILIDDGSVDSSLSICRNAAKNDQRIKVLHQENKGVSAARNLGLKWAEGEYVTFVDADDYIAPDYVEKLYLMIKHNRCNLSMCNYVEVCDGKEDKINIINTDGIMRSVELIEDTLYGRDEGGFCWGKMWRKSFLRHEFRNYRYCEDVLFCIENLKYGNERIAVISKPLYYYVRTGSSVTGKKKAADLIHTLDVASYIAKLSRNSSVLDQRAAYALALNYAYFAYLSTDDNDSDSKALRKRCLKWIKRLRGFVFWDFASPIKTKGAVILSLISMKLLKKVYSGLLQK